MKSRVYMLVALVFAGVLLAGIVSGCSHTVTSKAVDKSIAGANRNQKTVYQSKHEIEFRNYQWRQELADDPATILWCTFFPPGVAGVSDGSTPGQAFTVPIAGKLTSSNKRPYSSIRYIDAGSSSWYQQEVPGPDHMFGSSSEYRYGFGPNGKADYIDFTNFASVCTTQPKVWQANTPILTQASAPLAAITKRAEAALRAGDAKKAQAILATAGNVKAGK